VTTSTDLPLRKSGSWTLVYDIGNCFRKHDAGLIETSLGVGSGYCPPFNATKASSSAAAGGQRNGRPRSLAIREKQSTALSFRELSEIASSEGFR